MCQETFAYNFMFCLFVSFLSFASLEFCRKIGTASRGKRRELRIFLQTKAVPTEKLGEAIEGLVVESGWWLL